MAEQLTSAGLEIATLLDTSNAILIELRAEVDPVIGNDPATVIEAQEAAIYASHKREVAEIVQLLFDALDPSNAEGRLLENICALTGTRRTGPVKSAFKGTRQVTLNVAAGELIPAGQIFSQLDHPEVRAVTLTDADNTASAVNALILVDAEAEDAGPIEMPAGTMTVKVTNATGWLSVVNTEDALIGADAESDLHLRYKREQELAGAGSANIDAIRADLLKIALEDGSQPVLEALVLENPFDTYDSETGLPPHSIEAIVHDNGVTPDATIAAVVWSKAAGANTRGSIVETVLDSYGFGHEVRFSRVTPRALKLELTYKRDAITYVGDTAVKEVLAAASQQGFPDIESLPQRPGGMAEWSAYAAIAKAQPGVKNITLVRTALDGNAFGTSFTDQKIDFREIVTLDTSDITLLQ